VNTRQAIADALSTVDGVRGVAVPPDVLAPGAAWPTWISAAPATYGSLLDTWHVFVTLPNPTRATTVEASDPLVDHIWAALLDVGEVSIVEAAMVSDGDPSGTGQGLPALRFTLTTVGKR
jgi:hypothetical protein